MAHSMDEIMEFVTGLLMVETSGIAMVYLKVAQTERHWVYLKAHSTDAMTVVRSVLKKVQMWAAKKVLSWAMN